MTLSCQKELLKSTRTNKTLRKFCRQNDWGFINNNNIVAEKHLWRSRLHLNWARTSLLSQNLSTYINRHFTNVGHNLAKGIPHVDSQPEHYFIPTDKTSFKSCSANRVFKLLEKLEVKKATGLDNLPSKFLKIDCDILASSRTFVFNQSIASGIVPIKWKLANVTLVFN